MRQSSHLGSPVICDCICNDALQQQQLDKLLQCVCTKQKHMRGQLEATPARQMEAQASVPGDASA